MERQPQTAGLTLGAMSRNSARDHPAFRSTRVTRSGRHRQEPYPPRFASRGLFVFGLSGMLKLPRPPYAARIEALEHGVGRLDSAQMAACVRLPTLILRSRLLRCTFTVASVIRKMRAIPLFERPSTRWKSISLSRGVRRSTPHRDGEVSCNDVPGLDRKVSSRGNTRSPEQMSRRERTKASADKS